MLIPYWALLPLGLRVPGLCLVGRTQSFLVSPTTALHQSISIWALFSLVHLLKAASSNLGWGWGWRSLFSLHLHLSFCLCLPLHPLYPPYLQSNFWNQLKIWRASIASTVFACSGRQSLMKTFLLPGQDDQYKVILNWLTQRIVLKQYLFHMTHA